MVNKLQESIGKMAFETVHIVCGESPAGSVRVGLGRMNKVIGFPDFFPVGPIWKLHKDIGLKNRYEWLIEHLDMEDNYFEEEYEKRLIITLEELEAIPREVPIVVWTAENTDEQTGMRYFIYLLKNKPNDIFLINTTKAELELFGTRNVNHTGVVSPENLKLMYENKMASPLTMEERNKFQKEWLELANNDKLVRIYENEMIKSVSEEYFDTIIKDTVQILISEQEGNNFILAAEIIGEVLVISNQIVSADFLEYRIRCLVDNEVFDIKGVPEGKRNYSVRHR